MTDPNEAREPGNFAAGEPTPRSTSAVTTAKDPAPSTPNAATSVGQGSSAATYPQTLQADGKGDMADSRAAVAAPDAGASPSTAAADVTPRPPATPSNRSTPLARTGAASTLRNSHPRDASASRALLMGESSAASPTSQLPDPMLPPPSLGREERGFTAHDLIARQARLEREARQAVPFSFTRGGCTYERGYLRQPIYACKTCGGGGVCAGCSIGCHAEHDLVELFAKRNFRCDCGTLSMRQPPPAGTSTSSPSKHEQPELLPCSLRPKRLAFAPENDANSYTRNWHGHFCRCERGEHYDPETEEETMFQCLVCEDWFHETCTSLVPSNRGAASGAGLAKDETAVTTATTKGLGTSEKRGSEAAHCGEASSSVLPPSAVDTTTVKSEDIRAFDGGDGRGDQDGGKDDEEAPAPLIDHDAFDLHICSECVLAPGNEVLRHYVGARGWGACVPASAWRSSEDAEGEEAEKERACTADGRGENPWRGCTLVELPEERGGSYWVMGVPANEALRANSRRDGFGGVENDEVRRGSSEAVATGTAMVAPAAASSQTSAVAASVGNASAAKTTKRSTPPPTEADEDDGSGASRSKRAKVEANGEEDVLATMAEVAATVPQQKSTTTITDSVESHGGEAASGFTKVEAKDVERPCTLPRLVPIQGLRHARDSQNEEGAASTSGRPIARFDLFLAEDFREHICRCAECLPRWSKLSFVLEEEATYSPPRSEVDGEDGDEGAENDDAHDDEVASQHSQTSSTYDLAMAALATLPRQRMLDSLRAYGRLRDALFDHLRPFAREGRAVDEGTIRAFFESRREWQ